MELSENTAAAPTEGYARPASIEDATNRLFVHPLSEIVAKAAITLGVSANVISFTGLALGLIAAVFYYRQPEFIFVLAGFLSMVAWHVLDGADGRVARATGTSSAFGRIIDGICDHLVFTAVYVAMTLSVIAAGVTPWVWALAILAGIAHAFQAAAYEERRQQYQRRSRGETREAVNDALLSVDGKKSVFAIVYDAIQKIASPEFSELDDALQSVRLNSPDQIQRYVDQTAPLVHRWSLLNANNRTILIGIFTLIGQPVLYFVFELIVLNAVMIALLAHERQVESALANKIETEMGTA